MSSVPPKGWRRDRLKDVAAINPRSLSVSTNPDLEIEYLEISNVDSCGIIDRDAIEKVAFGQAPSRARRQVAKGATIISSVRPNLQAVAYIDGSDSHLVCSTGFNVVEPDEGVLFPRYLYYSLASTDARDYFMATSTGVGYPAIGDKFFGSFEITFPPLPEQRRIAVYLDDKCAAIDKAVAAKRKQLDTLEALWKSILNKAVVEGVLNAETLGRKETGVEWMPSIRASWGCKLLKRLLRCKLEYGLNEAAELEDMALPRYIRITDFGDDGNLKDDTFKSLPVEIASQGMLEQDDILFARSGATVGKSFIFSGWPTGACFAGYLIRARTKEWKLLPKFLYYFTKSIVYDDWKGLIFTQATIQNISAVRYERLPVPVPSIAEQRRIVAHLDERRDAIDSLKENLRRQIDVLEQYRKSLIHECVTGERRLG